MRDFTMEQNPDTALSVKQQYLKKVHLIPFMQRLHRTIITIFFITMLWGCSSTPQQSWIKLLPGDATFVIVPKPGVSLTSITNEHYATILDDLTPSPFQQLGGMSPEFLEHIDLKAAVLFPSTSTESELVWITESDYTLDEWASAFYEPFEQNNYQFNGLNVHRLHINGSVVFASQVHQWMVFSSTSIGTEAALRAYLGLSPSMELVENPEPGHLIMNVEHLDAWVQQFSEVTYRPGIMNSFFGAQPVSLIFTPSEDETPSFEISGTVHLQDTTRSTLIDALTYENRPLSLDRYIASNAAAFTIFRLPPTLRAELPSSRATKLDTLLTADPDLYRDLALSLEDEFGVVAFPESGLLANGEFLFLRKLENTSAFQNALDQLVEQSIISKQGATYYIKSEILGKLIGSEMAPFSDFYLSFSRDVAVISKRRGLSESVEADRVRRRTIYYEETYSKYKRTQPSDLSGFVWAYTNDFLKFINPFLMGKASLDGLIGQYDITTMSFVKEASSNAVEFSFRSVTEEGSTQPYDELWVLPMQGDELASPPVFANIVGSSTKEIIYSTVSGKVEALAFDGTSVMQAQTAEGDIPVGSPVLYDWYGNGQPIIMQAAGTKIYAWNEGGRSLPQFPIEVGEHISAPIVVTDVLRNGIPEIIVATENRKIHIIDGRGQNVRGWPQLTNAVVTQAPVYEQVDGTWSVWVYSQNILHGWLRSGQVRPGYPTFVNATFTTKPTIANSQILGGASDGYIYAIGKKPSFKDSLAVSIQMDSISIKSLYATSSPINSLSLSSNVLLKNDNGFYRSDLITAQSVNGSLLMFNPDGELEVTHSLGQPSSATMAPLLVDLNGDRNLELMALADFGRLFAWEILTDKRIFDIPTSGMTYPVVADLNDDGLNELIAFTREGLRCWTINKPE